jgi:hypothetical protein
MKYPFEGIAYILNFLSLCDIFIQVLTKNINNEFKYWSNKQFQIPCNILILFFLLSFSIVARSVRNTIGKVGATR